MLVWQHESDTLLSRHPCYLWAHIPAAKTSLQCLREIRTKFNLWLAIKLSKGQSGQREKQGKRLVGCIRAPIEDQLGTRYAPEKLRCTFLATRGCQIRAAGRGSRFPLGSSAIVPHPCQTLVAHLLSAAPITTFLLVLNFSPSTYRSQANFSLQTSQLFDPHTNHPRCPSQREERCSTLPR